MTATGFPTIGIVGGGLGGLVLARVLAVGGTSSTVLEREDGPDARRQGGSLDLHPESGQRALVAAGLIEQFHRYARPEGEEIRILDPGGREHLRHGASSTVAEFVPAPDGILPGRPEIDRARLRSMLLESLPEPTVRWGSHVTKIEAVAGGGYRVRCSDGWAAEFDVLVGADGARSRVRKLLTPIEPEPVGVTMAMMWLPDVTSRPDLVDLIGNGSLWCLGDNLNVVAQRSGNGDTRVALTLRETAGARRLPTQPGKPELLDLIAGWSPKIVDLVAAAGEEVQVYEISALPAELTWSSRPDVTLIGDAAHLMPPVGQGANQAMLDGAELGRAVLHGSPDMATALSAFEAAMFDRIRPIAKQSARIQDSVVAPDALTTMTRFFGA